MSRASRDFRKGKIYKILEWDGVYYYFLNNKGERSKWWSRRYGVEDVSYEGNLKEILE